MKRLVTKVNCFVFFGEELCMGSSIFISINRIARSLMLYDMDIAQNAEFTAAALEFPQAVIFAAEFLRITPRFMRPLVASIATHRHRAAKTLYQYLVPIVEQRLAVKDLQPHRVTPVRWDCPCPPTAYYHKGYHSWKIVWNLTC
jgi:hypothetical protein